MNTKILSIIELFLLRANDALLGLCLNNHSFSQENNDQTQENTYHIFQELEQHLEQSKKQLEEILGSQLTEKVGLILAIYADEIILTSGLYSNGYLWPKLQKKYLGNKDGGNVFFQKLDNILSSPEDEVPKILCEVFLYCLKNDFRGRHYGNQQALNYYSKKLSDRIHSKPQIQKKDHMRGLREYV